MHLGKKRTVIILVAIAVIIVGLFAVYEVTAASNDVKTDNFKVAFFGSGNGLLHPLPSEIERGTQADVGLIVNHTRSDTILKTSGSAASWAYFAYYTDPPYHMLAQNETTVTSTPNGGALIVINVPDDAQVGTYQITVTGTNNAGGTSSDTYTFAVT